MKRDITAVILAGGNSSRMGLNKSLLKINNSSFIDRTIILLENIFDDIIIVSNSPEDYTALGLQIFQDVYPGFGPLAGIHSGLMNSNSEKVFVVSNDLPFLNRELLEYLLTIKTENPIVVPKEAGHTHHLSGIYSKSCIDAAENILIESSEQPKSSSGKSGRKYNVRRLLDECGAEIVSIENPPFYSKDLFFNMNNYDDYNYVKMKLEKK